MLLGLSNILKERKRFSYEVIRVIECDRDHSRDRSGTSFGGRFEHLELVKFIDLIGSKLILVLIKVIQLQFSKRNHSLFVSEQNLTVEYSFNLV